MLEKEGVALDIGALSRRPAGPSHLVRRARWSRPTCEALTPWLDWAFATVAGELLQAA